MNHLDLCTRVDVNVPGERGYYLGGVDSRSTGSPRFNQAAKKTLAATRMTTYLSGGPVGWTRITKPLITPLRSLQGL